MKLHNVTHLTNYLSDIHYHLLMQTPLLLCASSHNSLISLSNNINNDKFLISFVNLEILKNNNLNTTYKLFG